MNNRRKKTVIVNPPGWRTGQVVFNFLEWCLVQGHLPENQNTRMADPFHIEDDEWDELMAKFMKEKNL